MGWQYLAFNVLTESNKTTVIKAYQMADNFITFNSTTPLRTDNGQWTDSDSNVLSVGAMMENSGKATEFIVGLFHEITFYTYPLSLA